MVHIRNICLHIMITIRKIRIAFFAETLERDIDGAVRTMYQLINRIPQTKFEFQFFTAVPPKDFGKLPFRYVILESLPIPFSPKYKFVNILTQKPRLYKELKSFKPDVIHIASPSMMGQVAADYGKKNNIPVISIYHTHFSSYISFYFHNLPFITDLATSYANHKIRTFYGKCNKVLAPTKTIKKYLVDQNVNEKNIDIWARGIDAHLFTPKKRSSSFIEEITGNNKKNILFVSRLVWEKNLKLLVQLYRYSLQHDNLYNFILAGDGSASEQLQQEMPKALFLGNCDHHFLAKLYASSDYFVFPSTSETYGNVLLEAMASGLPCIAADGGANVDIIKQGINGFLSRTDDASDYFNKIQLLEQHQTLSTLIRENALEFARSSSWDQLSKEYFNLLKAMSNNKQKYIRLKPKRTGAYSSDPVHVAI